MASVINKIFTDRMGGRKAAEYIGTKGDLFYDSDVGDIRISDGVTVGGKPMGGGATATGIYRGYQAGVNIIRQNRTNGEYDMAQIFIHDGEGRADYINYTRDTDNDDFYITGLSASYDELADNQWQASNVIALNVYSATNGGLNTGDLRTFVRKFIDTVLYDDQDQKVNNLQTAKDLFYANIEVLTNSLPAGSLYDGFYFGDLDRWHNPEYNMTRADGSTEDLNYTANVKIGLDPYNEGAYPGYDAYNEIANIQIVNAGSGYAIGDKIIANGAQMGGTDGVNDFTLTVTGLKSGNITELQITSGGTNFYPHTNAYSWDNIEGEVAGTGAGIHITQCSSAGEITGWELRNGGGSGYQVGDVLAINFGGDQATFEVMAVGTDGIADYTIEGNAHLGAPHRAQNGYYPNYYIDDGLNDQYDKGNTISTDYSSSSYIADFSGNKMTFINPISEGSVSLERGMFGMVRDSDNAAQQNYFRLVSQAPDNSNVWFIDSNLDFTEVQVRIDGINYNNGEVTYGGGFGSDEGSGYVTVYDQSIFAMMAFNIAGVNSVYYNGNTGADSNGSKEIEVLLGVSGNNQESKLIPQNLTFDSNYTLQTTDIGKHLYNPGSSLQINIPPDSVANFPVGSAITFVSSNGNIVEIHRDLGSTTQIWGAGLDTESAYWAIPSNSMGTLLKVGPDKWIVSGAGLYNND